MAKKDKTEPKSQSVTLEVFDKGGNRRATCVASDPGEALGIAKTEANHHQNARPAFGPFVVKNGDDETLYETVAEPSDDPQ